MSRRLAGVAALLTLPILLQGCLLTRMVALQEQLCDYEANFDLRVDEAVTLAMHHPVLLEEDVTWLAGAQPTQRRVNGKALELGYVVEKVTSDPDPNYDFPVRLRFVHIDGDFKLQEGRLERNLGAVLDPSLMANATGHACGATPNLLSRSMNVDLSELDRSVLPTRGELVEILGAPGEVSSDGAVLTYRYRLRNSQRKETLAQATAWFDPSGRELRRVQFRYQRYEMDADFVTLNAAIRLRL